MNQQVKKQSRPGTLQQELQDACQAGRQGTCAAARPTVSTAGLRLWQSSWHLLARLQGKLMVISSATTGSQLGPIRLLWNRYGNAHCIVAQPHSEGKVPSCKENSSPSDIAAPALTCTNGGQAFKQHCLHKAPSTNAQCALMLNLTVVRNNKTAVRPSNGIC